jgi:hypothetical protein
MFEGELFVINFDLKDESSMEIAKVHGVFSDIVSNLIG